MSKNETKSIDPQILEIKSLLINKIAAGDYITLSKMLSCEQETARKRFHRNNPEAIRKMQLIIETRERLIADNTK